MARPHAHVPICVRTGRRRASRCGRRPPRRVPWPGSAGAVATDWPSDPSVPIPTAIPLRGGRRTPKRRALDGPLFRFRPFRSSVRNRGDRLYSTSRGHPLFCPAQDVAPAGRRPRPARGIQPGGPRLVRRDVRRADPRPGGRLGGDLGRSPRADPRPDRERQDPRRVPVVPRPARPRPDPAGDPRAPRSRPGPLRLAAQGAVLRRRAEPAGAAGRDRPRRRPPRRGRPGDLGRAADRRHERRGAADHRPPPAGHPHHHARIALPAPDQPGAREPPRRRARDRRRGPRDRRDEAGRPPRAQPRAARAPPAGRRAAAPADRPVGDPAPARDDRPLPRRGRSRARGRGSSMPAPASRSSCQVVVPVEDMGRLGEPLPLDEQPGGPAAGPEARVSIWPAIHPRILELIRAHRSTIVFCNSRRLAERLAQRLNELAGEELVRAHHGSIAREQRVAIEEALKAGRLPAIVATSSLELGIDMGAVDLVIQVESPTSVARGLQRIGRAGHQVDAPSRGVIFPKYRGDLLEAAVVAERMHAGAIETTTIPRNPLDVLAQQLVAMTVMDRWTVDDLHAAVTRAMPYETLGREPFEGVLAMLAGAYPSDEFAELKARVVWDRVTGVVEGRRDARVVAVTSGGTIPDRGLYGVFLVGEPGTPGRRVGELDEEMVYESRVGEVITLGASAWRIEEISHDRVVVSPAPGRAGQAAVLARRRGRPADRARPGARRVRRRAGGGPRPRDARPVGRPGPARRAPRPRPAGGREPARLPRGRARRRRGAADGPAGRRRALPRRARRLAAVPADAVRRPGPRAVGARPRGAPGRAPRRPRSRRSGRTTGSRSGCPTRELDGHRRRCSSPTPTRSRSSSSARSPTRPCSRRGSARTPPAPCSCPGAGPGPGRRSGSSASGRPTCWPSPAATAASRSSSRRIASACPTCSTCRPCARSSPGVARREIAVHRVETVRASPFASSLLFDYVAAYMYEGDAPLAERRAQALTLDRDLLRELLGQEELRELLDPAALADLELGAPGPGRRAAGDDRRPAPRPPPAGRRPVRGGGRRVAAPSRRGGERGLARRAGGRPAGGGRPDRRRAALDRDRGRRALPRRRRRPAAGRRAARVPRADGRRARGAPRPVRPDPRPVPVARAGAPLGPPGRGRRGRPRPAARRRVAPARRVPAGWRRARVVRPRGPPPAPPPLARPSPARGRAGRAGRARPVPARLAGGGAARATRRRSGRGGSALPRLGRARAARRGRRPARRAADPGLDPRARRPAGADPRLPAAPPRRARRARRGRLGRAGEPRPRRRPARAVPPGTRGAPLRGRRPGVRRGRRRGTAGRPAPRGDPGAPRPAAAPRSIARSTRRPGAAPIARCSTPCGTSSGPAR